MSSSFASALHGGVATLKDPSENNNGNYNNNNNIDGKKNNVILEGNQHQMAIQSQIAMQMSGLTNNAVHFTNQTGFVLQCPVARELARAIERASIAYNNNRFASDNNNNFVQSQQKLSFIAQQQQNDAAVANSFFNENIKQPIQIRWEKSDSGEQIEPILYSQQPTESQLQDNNEQQINVQQQQQILRQVRQSDGALIFEPFAAHQFRPDVHLATYRCVASSLGHSASLMSRDFRLEATIWQPISNQQQFAPEVMDELVIEGNDAQFKCRIPVTLSISQQQQQHQQFALNNNNNNNLLLSSKDQFQVLDWIEYPSEQVYSFQSTTQDYATTKLFAKSKQSTKFQSSDLQLRYFVAPQSGDLHILQVDSSLNYRSFKCRVKNKLTGEIIMSQNKAKLIVTGEYN